ncbi:hypothetical protein [Kribbella sp. NPDC048928]|uniref:hypothetical protein n=1 Tax=Kribbella sp. NPDC048928 TaxID=3364111 RepID=UPI003718C58B
MNWQRRARTAATVLAFSFVITAQLALAADPNQGPTNPTGFADLLPTPDLTHGDGRTLFEQYSPMLYGLDFDKSLRDPIDTAFNGYANMMMMYIVVVMRGAISVGWWLFSFTDIQPVNNAASGAIGAINGQLVGWLLPSALAFGAIAAYTQRRSTGSAMGQLVWVLAAGILATSFAVAPRTWLNGVDGARQVGAQAVMEPAKDALGSTVQSPIPWPEPGFTGSTSDTLLRKSADATWRGFVVTPWCVADLGSIEACKRYGKAILDKGTDGEARKDYIEKDIPKAEGGDDAGTSKWAKGDNPFGRIGVLALAAVAASMFAFLSIGLAFTALMAFVGCLLLLVVGVFFACLWIIPGRPRQWGVNWFEALLGLVLQSILAMLVFSATLTLVTAVFSLTGSLGWLPVSGLAIAVLMAAFRLRRLLESMAGMMRPGAGSLAMGGMARRGAMTAMRRILGAVGGRAASPTVAERNKERTTAQERSSTQRVSSVRIFRQAPGYGSPGAQAANEFSGPSQRRSLPATGSADGRHSGASRSGEALQRSRLANAQSPRGLGSRRQGEQDAKGDTGRTLSVNAAGVISPVGKGVSSAGGGTSSQSRVKTSSDGARGRHSRRAPVEAAGSRYEPRTYSHSASLRDGPPKGPRERRRLPSTKQRRYRDYSSVSKDGVTVLVPGRGRR